jgi:DNA-binding NtrC family response regulator
MKNPRVDREGRARATVLITGPSGTGKELVARSCEQSLVKSNPFIR